MRKLYAERPGWGADFDYDEGRHLVPYQFVAPLVRGKRVLDAGCGEGFCTQQLAASAREVVGVDYHAEAIETARRRCAEPNLSFRVTDLAKFPVDAAAFDVVLCFQVLEHISEELPFLRNLRAALAPGGKLVLTTPNVVLSFSENPCHLREYTAEQLRRLLGEVFSEVELKGVFGNQRIAAFDAERSRGIARILRLDPFGLRRFLPTGVSHFAFARLGQLVRRRAHTRTGLERITCDDFEVRAGEVERALDLVAICGA